MKFTFNILLLAASVLSLSTSYSYEQNPFGEGILKIKDYFPRFPKQPYSEINAFTANTDYNDAVEQFQHDTQNLCQEIVVYINKIREQFSKFDYNTLLKKIHQLLSSFKIIEDFGNRSKTFIDLKTAVISKELLRGLLHIQRKENMQVTKEDAQEFARIMTNSKNRRIYSLLIEQMLTINSEEKNKVATKDEDAIMFDSLYIHEIFYQTNDDTSLENPTDQFYKALFYKYIRDAQTFGPSVAYNNLLPLLKGKVTNFKQFKEQFKEIWDKYKNEVIINYIKLKQKKAQSSKVERRNEFLQSKIDKYKQYTDNYITSNATEMIEKCNSACDKMKNHFEALPNVILTINAIAKNFEEETKKLK